MQNCQRFTDEHSKALDKISLNTRIVNNWPSLVIFLDANYSPNQQDSTLISHIRGDTNITIRTNQILGELNAQSNYFNNTQGNRYNENNTHIGLLTNFAQLNINSSQQKLVRDSAILRELTAKAAQHNLTLTGYTPIV